MDDDTYERLKGLTAAARLVAARHQGMEERKIAPHRMEPVATVRGVDYINDSSSTFLDASLQSLAGLDRPVIWLAGAIGPEVSAGYVQEFLRERIAALVLFGRGRDRAIEALQPFTPHVYLAEELRTAVFLAHEVARSGEVVLFSPACPSGDGFANYEERGVEFKRAVKDL